MNAVIAFSDLSALLYWFPGPALEACIMCNVAATKTGNILSVYLKGNLLEREQIDPIFTVFVWVCKEPTIELMPVM